MVRTGHEIFSLLIAVVVFCLILASYLLRGCDPCANTIQAEAKSPDGKYIATAFIRDCGATTDFSPQVHLRAAGERSGKTGNVFIGEGSTNIQISWLSATQLVVYSDCQVFQHITNLHGITIEKRGAK
jgi:hypothetical protein